MANTAKRFTTKERAAHVKAFHESGLSQIAFAKGKPFSYNTLNAWLQKEKKASKAAKDQKALAKRLDRAAAANGRFVPSDSPSEPTPVARASSPVEQLSESELRQLVRLQAQVLARYI